MSCGGLDPDWRYERAHLAAKLNENWLFYNFSMPFFGPLDAGSLRDTRPLPPRFVQRGDRFYVRALWAASPLKIQRRYMPYILTHMKSPPANVDGLQA
jgi:hypothetical protein